MFVDGKTLDNTGPYYDMGVRKATAPGLYHYMCTRNNNFSNRDQKGEIIVYDYQIASGQVDSQGGIVAFE